MASRPDFTLSTVVLGTPAPRALAEFYQQLLGWPFGADEDDWVTLRNPDAYFSLAFQLETEHVEPVWPAASGDQQMQVHLDIEVSNLDGATAFAESLGARVAEEQPQSDVRVMLDPAGHPFCIWVSE